MRVTSKAAWLDQGRILAINRSHVSSGTYLVDEIVTGEYIRQALSGFDYDYYSDTAHQEFEKLSSLSLYDLIDYELVIIGGESARLDDLGESASNGGRLDTLAYYLSIGGKAIVFGRWGELDFEMTLPYDPGSQGYSYNQSFGITARHLVLTSSSGTELQSDLIGGQAQISGYPDLTWDSLATVSHSQPYTDVSGIPCVSYPTLDQPGLEILYTYNSSDDEGLTEGQPMAWRNWGPESQYAYFEFPLSFMDRDGAVAALGRAVMDFGFAAATTEVSPGTIDVWADEAVMAYVLLGDFTGGYTATDVNVASIMINDALVPTAVEILPPPPEFEGDVLLITVPSSEFADTYGEIVGDGLVETYTLSWQYDSEAETHTVNGDIIVNGYICGDANTDGEVNVGDAVFIIRWVFTGGPPPYPYLAADVNADGSPNVGDAVYIIAYVFKGGPDPDCWQ
jgi:hypothetical protein